MFKLVWIVILYEMFIEIWIEIWDEMLFEMLIVMFRKILDESKIFFFDLFLLGGVQCLSAEEFRIWKCSRPLTWLSPLGDDLQKSVRALPLQVTLEPVLFIFSLFWILKIIIYFEDEMQIRYNMLFCIFYTLFNEAYAFKWM